MIFLEQGCNGDSEDGSSDVDSDTDTDSDSDSDSDIDTDSGDVCVNGNGVEIDGNTYSFSKDELSARVIFFKHDMVRIWLAADGDFTNPAEDKIVINYDFPDITTSCYDRDTYLELQSNKLIVRIYKDSLKLAMYRAHDNKVIWEEIEPIALGTTTSQRLIRGDDEYFFGGGMQNGYFSHRDTSIKISVQSGNINWDDGGHPNPAPFYMSTNGYGVLRNTFKRGVYDFSETLDIKHRENRFDAFYFYGPSLKEILDGYTELTGRPFLAPIWGLEFGDADCYNTEGTTSDILEVAKEYRNNDMPGGWVLPNDGYGCGYQDLPSVVEQLDGLGFYTGLWTENGLNKIAWEVDEAGTRACKLDIAWVYRGYSFALNASKQASDGIEGNSDARRFIWTTMGWAGTHRYSVMWTGDNSGNWEYIRFQIPTVIGSGLSAQNYATGDVDGIFRGSAETYVRDLQWKIFTPSLMTISGWADYDKQPWRYGEPYTSYNRDYLKLKMRLTPYLYTYCNEAYETGVPTKQPIYVAAMVFALCPGYLLGFHSADRTVNAAHGVYEKNSKAPKRDEFEQARLPRRVIGRSASTTISALPLRTFPRPNFYMYFVVDKFRLPVYERSYWMTLI